MVKSEVSGVLISLLLTPNALRSTVKLTEEKRRTAMTLKSLCVWLSANGVLLASVFLLSHSLFAQTPFYQGKTITIVHGRAPGGSGDLRVRAVIPFLQKYIPGNPTFVHEYMDGGGGVANAILGEQGVQYDLDKLHFIGSPYSATHYMFVTRREVGLKNLEKL